MTTSYVQTRNFSEGKKKGRSSFHCNKSLCFEHFSHKTCPRTQQHNATFCLPTHFPQIAKPINTTGPLRSARQKGEEFQAQNNCFTDKLDNAGPKLKKKTQRNSPEALSATRSKSRFFIPADKRADQNLDRRHRGKPPAHSLLEKGKILRTITQACIPGRQ